MQRCSEPLKSQLCYRANRQCSNEKPIGSIAALRGQGIRVVMITGNDALPLAQADVGLAIGAGTDIAIESAGVILATSDPRDVVGVRTLSRHPPTEKGAKPYLDVELQLYRDASNPVNM